MSEDEASSSSIGLSTLLTVLFVGLKLTRYIDWSWWWVLSPIWISWGIAGVILIGATLVLFVCYLLEHR